MNALAAIGRGAMVIPVLIDLGKLIGKGFRRMRARIKARRAGQPAPLPPVNQAAVDQGVKDAKDLIDTIPDVVTPAERPSKKS